MGSHVLVLFFILIFCNILGFFLTFILREKKKIRESRIQVDIDDNERFGFVNIINFAREISGFLCIVVAILGIISFFYNREFLLAIFLMVFFLISVLFAIRLKTKSE